MAQLPTAFDRMGSKFLDRDKEVQREIWAFAQRGLVSVRPFMIALLLGLSTWFVMPSGIVDSVWSDLLLANQKITAKEGIANFRPT